MTGRYARIMADLEDGIDFKTIAKKYGTDKATINVYNKARTHTLTVYIPPAPLQEPRPEAELPIVDLYRAGHDIEEIARMKHINVQAVSWELEVARVTKRGTWTVHIPTDDEVDQIVALYSAGESARLIARRFRMSEFRVRKYLELRNVQAPLKGIYALTEGKHVKADQEIVLPAQGLRSEDVLIEDMMTKLDSPEVLVAFGAGTSLVVSNLVADATAPVTANSAMTATCGGMISRKEQ